MGAVGGPGAELAPEGCSARLALFAERLALALGHASFAEDASPAHILGGVVALAGGSEGGGGGAPGGLSVLERGLGEAALAAIGAGEGDSEEELRAAAVRAVSAFAAARVARAGGAAAAAAQALCFERGWERVALLAGSSVAADAVAAMAPSLQAVAVIDASPRHPGRADAARLAETRVPVRYGLLPAAHDLLAGHAALLLGAEEVAMNGAVLAAPGAAAVAALARDAGAVVVVVAQTAKFSDAVLIDVEVAGRDVLRPGDVDMIITEDGQVEPVMAPLVLKKGAHREATRV